MNRREFLAAGGVLAAASAVGAADTAPKAAAPAEGAAEGRLIVSPPVLQNAAETSMGVGFAVSAMARVSAGTGEIGFSIRRSYPSFIAARAWAQ